MIVAVDVAVGVFMVVGVMVSLLGNGNEYGDGYRHDHGRDAGVTGVWNAAT